MKLSIIILNFNTKALLTQVLDSIETKNTIEIIVVDNASTDGSVEFLARHYPNVKIIKNPVNNGFAAGNNLGIKASSGKYLLLLNSDTQAKPNSLDKCLNFLDRHPQIGILTPKLTLSDGALDLASHRGFPTIANSLAYFAKLD